MEIVGECDCQRSFEQDHSFTRPVPVAIENRPLAVHGLRKGLRLVEGLGQYERTLEVGLCALVFPREPEEAANLGCDRCDVLLRARRLEGGQRRLEARHRLRRMAVDEVDIGQSRGGSCSGDGVAELLERRVGAF